MTCGSDRGICILTEQRSWKQNNEQRRKPPEQRKNKKLYAKHVTRQIYNKEKRRTKTKQKRKVKSNENTPGKVAIVDIGHGSEGKWRRGEGDFQKAPLWFVLREVREERNVK